MTWPYNWASGLILPKSVPYGGESPVYTAPTSLYVTRPVFQLTLNQHLNRSWRLGGWGKVRVEGTYQTISNVVLGAGDGWKKTFTLEEEFTTSPSLPGNFGLWASKSGSFEPQPFKGENIEDTAGDDEGMWREWVAPGPLTTPTELIGSGLYYAGADPVSFNAYSRLIITFEGRASTFRSGGYYHNVIKVTATEEVTTDISVDPIYFESLLHKDADNTAEFYIGGWSGGIGDIPTSPHDGAFIESDYYGSANPPLPATEAGSISFEFLDSETETLELRSPAWVIPVLEGDSYEEVNAVHGLQIYFEEPLEWDAPPPL